MEKLFCIICGKYVTFEKPKLSYLLDRNISSFYYCRRCKNGDEKIFKEEEESIEIIKIFGLIENIKLF